MLKCFVGWDPRDINAFEVCHHTLIENASIEVEVIPLKDWELRRKGAYWRSYRVDSRGQKWDDRDGKPFGTDFSFTRFLVPALEEYKDEWVMFCDPDFLWRSDVAALLDLIEPDKALMCVKHDHRPVETEKGVGIQTVYDRKNWSSLMLMNPYRNRALSKRSVSLQPGSYLHAMLWLEDHEIGELPEEWNWLEDWSDPRINPKVVHMTRGTPDMPGYEDVAYADEWWNALSARIGNGR